MKIRPLNDRVVVRRKEEEETSAGGILLPGTAKEKPNEGEVIAVGEGRLLDNGEVRPLSVKVGDKVIFGPYAGGSNTIKDGDDELIIMSESEIFGVIEG
ncbi:MAG TPA: co-chaperone GroES [Porticoccaceae bacterium]|nr:co-chaperone GroES [Porticoccaceae bacterium]